MGGTGLLLGAVPGLLAWPPAVIWNATASAPQGLYRLQPMKEPSVGQLVAVRPPPPLAGWLARREAAPDGVLLIKRVAGLFPSTVCWSSGAVSIDGRLAARVRTHDRERRPLPVLHGCRRLDRAQVFLLNDVPGSLDGRYFGPLPRHAVVGRVTPIWLVNGAGHVD
jgi:type IV secretory pathway protease TraF